MQAIPKFLHLLRQHDFEIMAFFSDNEYLRTAVIYSLRSGSVFGIRLDEGVFDVHHLTPDITHYITQNTETTPISTMELFKCFHSTLEKSLEKMKKEGESSAPWGDWAYHFFDKGHLAYQSFGQSFGQNSEMGNQGNNENNEKFVQILDFLPTYTGFILLLSFEQFLKSKTVLHTTIPQITASLQGQIKRFIENTFDKWRKEYDFVEDMKSCSFLASSPEHLSTTFTRKQKLYLLLQQVHKLIRSIQKELYHFEENSVEWTFQETMDFARRKRELYKHLDKLRLLCKHAEEMLWILHIHLTSTIVLFQSIHQKLETTIDQVEKMLEFKGTF